MHTKQQLKQEYDRSRRNKEVLSQTKECACFYCLRKFSPSQINEWVDRDGTTALCPFCGTDAVTTSTNPELIQELHEHYFHIDLDKNT